MARLGAALFGRLCLEISRWFPGCPVPSISAGASPMQGQLRYDGVHAALKIPLGSAYWRATVYKLLIAHCEFSAACVGWPVVAHMATRFETTGS